MSLLIGDNFNYQGRKPLDNRLVVSSLSDLTSMAQGTIYNGIIVYVSDEKKFYVYDENNEEDAGTGKWKELQTGEGVSTTDKSIDEYLQGKSYKKDTLLYTNNFLLRVVADFISDNTNGYTIAQSLEVDLLNNKVVIINKEAQQGIMRYKQNTFYEKDKLVYADKRIGRVLNDYISDNTGATLEESVNLDIAAGNLLEIGENYKFKLYKTSQDLNKTIDAINTIPISTIQFESGDSIANMQLNEGVYGNLGTLALIKEIDINTQTIKAKTVNSREMEFMPPAPDEYTTTINVAGTSYQEGDIFNSSVDTLSIKVTAVGTTGEITAVELIDRCPEVVNGTGAIISVTPVLYLGHYKSWIRFVDNENELSDPVLQYIPNTSYVKNTLIYDDSGLYNATTNFTATDINSDIGSGYLLQLSATQVDIPACLGSYPTDETDMLPQNPVQGNWVIIQDCTQTSAGNGGIGLYNGTSWEIIVLPKGNFEMEEPTTLNKPHFRIVETSEAGNEGKWVEFTGVDGSNYQITIKESANDAYIPAKGEFVLYNDKVILGDGTKNLMALTPFYESTLTNEQLITILGYTPEDVANKGVAGGYAALDENGKIPTGNLPDELVDTYSKTEIDTKDTNIKTELTTSINTEATRAAAAETTIDTKIDNHIADTAIHVSQTEKDAWNAKVDAEDIQDFDNHLTDTVVHVTQADKDKWNGSNKAYFVTNVNDLPATDNQIGNIGYVQTSAVGVTPIVCDQYIWNGTKWEPIDSTGVSLDMKWGNIQDRPSSTPLSIDNTVTVAHSHINKDVLDKIGQTENGAFTFNNIPVGIRAVFCQNDNLLPDEGESDVLYVVYKDSRVRNFPSISVWEEGVFQVLGRGTQEAPPTVGEMSILQAEYFSVTAGSTFSITINPQSSFCYMPVEILKEIAGLQNQSIDLITLNNSDKFIYNNNLFDITANKYLQINNKELKTTVTTVGDFFYSEVEVDLSEYKDVTKIS